MDKTRMLDFKYVVFLAVILMLGACSDRISDDMWESVVRVMPAEDLEQDFDEMWPDSRLKYLLARYWTDRFDGETRATWEMEAPYFREMFTFSEYDSALIKTRSNELLEIRVHGIEQEAERMVSILLELSFRGVDGRERSSYMSDRWLQMGGNWFHVERDEFIFPT